jgi:hypothetical protein
MAIFNKAEIKVGDKVLKIGRYEAIPQVSTIEAITKTGFKVDGKIYYENGLERTTDRYPSFYIIPFSQAKIDEAEMRKANKTFSNEVFNRLSKLKTDYQHSEMNIENAKILDAALKQMGY